MRQLENAIEHAVSLTEAESISLEDLLESILGPTFADQPLFDLPLREAKRLFEKEYIRELMRRTKGNITRAAQLAGIARQNLHQKLKSYGIRGKEFK